VVFALIKMAANRQDVYALVEAGALARQWGVVLHGRHWALALQTAWAARGTVPDDMYRSCFSALLREIQKADVTLDFDTTQTVVQFLVDTEPSGELTWRMLARLVRVGSVPGTADARTHIDTHAHTHHGPDASFIQCAALTSLLLQSVGSRSDVPCPVETTEPLYESEKYLHVWPRQLSGVGANVCAYGEGVVCGAYLHELRRLWGAAEFGSRKGGHWAAMQALLEVGMGSHIGLGGEDQDHQHRQQGDGDGDSGVESRAFGQLCGLADQGVRDPGLTEALTDSITLLVVVTAFHTTFYGRNVDRGYALLYAWAQELDLRSVLEQ